MKLPRILIAGLSGGSGKTVASLGLAAAWRKRGRRVVPFKKGPDYIDAAWLSAAAGRPCRNLDLFLMSEPTVLQSFVAAASLGDVAVIEGNRGLYDGTNATGTYSTAELAKLLQVPVVLIIDCTKSTRSAAACVLGCQHLDPQVPIRGVILNQTAGPRHESILREAVAQICGLPVLGALARSPQPLLPERHLGLVPPEEHGQRTGAMDRLADVAEQCLDLQTMQRLAREAPDIGPATMDATTGPVGSGHPLARVGVFRDAAFQFYYPENLEALVREGARLIEISPLRDRSLPEVDALYIGGGFPESFAPDLASNTAFAGSLRRSIEEGLPVYAECGGTVYLGQSLVVDRQRHAMAAVLPVQFAFGPKPDGHGYTVLEAVADNPFFAVGDSVRGHEFHYTYMQSSTTEDLTFAFRVRRGHGFDGRRDGLCYRNVLASYTHVHALGEQRWASRLVQAAVSLRSQRRPPLAATA